VCDLAVRVGQYQAEQSRTFSRDAVETKRSHDYVSYVDKESERMIVAALRELLPDAGFITEEKTTEQNSAADDEWIIDPLDGTTNFIHDMGPWCVCIGCPYDAEAFRQFCTTLTARLYGHCASLRSLGSAEAELCYIAAGRLDVYIESFLNPWDVSAGAVILQEAGGAVSDYRGENKLWQSGCEVLATNGKLHNAMLEEVRRCRTRSL